MIWAPVDQNSFCLWKFDGRKVFQEHLQFRWCPSPSNDKDIDRDVQLKKVQQICMSEVSEVALRNKKF